jgi:hypothetical protein
MESKLHRPHACGRSSHVDKPDFYTTSIGQMRRRLSDFAAHYGKGGA